MIETNQWEDLSTILRDPLAARNFNLRDWKFLQPRKRAQGYRHARISGPCKQQECLFGDSLSSSVAGLFGQGAVSCFVNYSGPLRQAQHVENQGYLSIAHDAGSGKRLDRLQLFAKRLHNNLFGIVDAVDHESELALVCLQYDYVDCAVSFSDGTHLGCQLQLAAEV